MSQTLETTVPMSLSAAGEVRQLEQLFTFVTLCPQSITIFWGQRSLRRNISFDVSDRPDAQSTTTNCTKDRKDV